jgi:hypothetical protein
VLSDVPPLLVEFPAESWGKCRRKICRYIGQLGNGLCANHYDKTISRGRSRRPMLDKDKARLKKYQ